MADLKVKIGYRAAQAGVLTQQGTQAERARLWLAYMGAISGRFI